MSLSEIEARHKRAAEALVQIAHPALDRHMRQHLRGTDREELWQARDAAHRQFHEIAAAVRTDLVNRSAVYVRAYDASGDRHKQRTVVGLLCELTRLDQALVQSGEGQP